MIGKYLWHIALLSATVAMALQSCKDDPSTPAKMEFPGILFRDEYGNHTGTYGGTDDNDWKYDAEWSQEIWNAVNYNDTVDLSGTYLNQTYVAPEEIPFSFFPNPVASTVGSRIIMPGRIKVKMAMVDKELNRIATFTYTDQDTSWVMLDMADTALFVEGEVYRIYYTFSVEGNENFYKGHGDVLMCYQRPANLLCVEYLEE